MAQRKPIKESPSPSASTRKASSTRYDTQFNPVDTTKGIAKGLAQTLWNVGTVQNGGVWGVGKGVVQSFAGTVSRVDDYAVRALNATGIKKATNVELQIAKRNTYGHETADLLNVLVARGGAKALTSVRLVRGVPETAKILQRELAKELKSQSTKGMSRKQKENFYESRNDSFDDAIHPDTAAHLEQKILRDQISELMKSQKGPLKIKRR